MVAGNLSHASCLSNGFRLDAYEFQATAGKLIQIVLESGDFYTYQALFGPNGGDAIATASEDLDDGKTVLTIKAPTTGAYHLLVTSVDPLSGGPGYLGAYNLRVTVSAIAHTMSLDRQ